LTSMSTDRSEDRASLCFLTFVDGRHCRIPHALRAHAGIRTNPVPSMVYFITSGYTGVGVRLKNLTTLRGTGQLLLTRAGPPRSVLSQSVPANSEVPPTYGLPSGWIVAFTRN
jgi:hypothetical protein